MACLVPGDVVLVEGQTRVSVAEYAGLQCRVCRPVGLAAAEIDAVIRFVMARLGHQYDLKNVIDSARYLLPTPTVPLRWRRRMLALGGGDPTGAICSTLTAQAFQSVRHHSLFVPRDFDVSPYFVVIKPTLAAGFNHRALAWRDDAQQAAA